MIFRLILVGLLIWAIYQVIRVVGKSGGNGKIENDQPEKMLQCDYCGTHVPAHQAVRNKNKNYCCARHRDLDNAS